MNEFMAKIISIVGMLKSRLQYLNGLLSWSSVAQEEKWQLLEQFLIFLPLETNAILAVDFCLKAEIISNWIGNWLL